MSDGIVSMDRVLRSLHRLRRANVDDRSIVLVALTEDLREVCLAWHVRNERMRAHAFSLLVDTLRWTPHEIIFTSVEPYAEAVAVAALVMGGSDLRELRRKLVQHQFAITPTPRGE